MDTYSLVPIVALRVIMGGRGGGKKGGGREGGREGRRGEGGREGGWHYSYPL